MGERRRRRKRQHRRLRERETPREREDGGEWREGSMGAGVGKKGTANQLGSNEYTREVELRTDMTSEQNEKGEEK